MLLLLLLLLEVVAAKSRPNAVSRGAGIDLNHIGAFRAIKKIYSGICLVGAFREARHPSCLKYSNFIKQFHTPILSY